MSELVDATHSCADFYQAAAAKGWIERTPVNVQSLETKCNRLKAEIRLSPDVCLHELKEGRTYARRDMLKSVFEDEVSKSREPA